MTSLQFVAAVLVAMLTSKAWDLIINRVNRKDSKEDKQDRVLQALKDIRKDITSISNKVDENAAVLARTHILRFNDELINGVEHTQEYFNQQLQDIDTYEAYCESHPQFRNTYAILAIQNIQTTYSSLMEKGAFSIKED